MKIDQLKKRLERNRPMTPVTIRMPEDVIEDLKRLAPILGVTGYQPLIRAYIGQGLRADMERLHSDYIALTDRASSTRVGEIGAYDEVIETVSVHIPAALTERPKKSP